METSSKQITMTPIGVVRTRAVTVPRHCRISNVEGQLEIEKQFARGLADIHPGEQIVVIFCFHRSPAFTSDFLEQTPPHRSRPFGVFSTCSPRRPNPIGMSVLEVLEVCDSIIRVRGLDMLDGTPVLDIKPYMEFEEEGESYESQ